MIVPLPQSSGRCEVWAIIIPGQMHGHFNIDLEGKRPMSGETILKKNLIGEVAPLNFRYFFLSHANECVAIDKGLRGQWSTVLWEKTSHWWSIEFHQWVERRGISRWCWVNPPGYPLPCCWVLAFKPHGNSLKWIRCFSVRTKTVKPWMKVMFSNFLALNQPVISYLWCQVTKGELVS